MTGVARVLGAGTLVAAGVAASGCLPLPWPRSVAFRPELEVRVRDAATGRPLAGARVRIVRYNLGPPPERVTHRHEAVGARDGIARFERLSGSEWTMPLMIHGVPQWCFSICVEADGYGAISRSWPDFASGGCGVDADRPLPPLEVALTAGDAPCDFRNANGMPIRDAWSR